MQSSPFFLYRQLGDWICTHLPSAIFLVNLPFCILHSKPFPKIILADTFLAGKCNMRFCHFPIFFRCAVTFWWFHKNLCRIIPSISITVFKNKNTPSANSQISQIAETHLHIPIRSHISYSLAILSSYFLSSCIYILLSCYTPDTSPVNHHTPHASLTHL